MELRIGTLNRWVRLRLERLVFGVSVGVGFRRCLFVVFVGAGGPRLYFGAQSGLGALLLNT